MHSIYMLGCDAVALNVLHTLTGTYPALHCKRYLAIIFNRFIQLILATREQTT